jgi:hypothetical protein
MTMCLFHNMDPRDLRPEREPPQSELLARAYVERLETLRQQIAEMVRLAAPLGYGIDTEPLDQAQDCLHDMKGNVMEAIELP